MAFEWKGKRVVVLGGCSFIGSNLVDALVKRNAQVKVVDDLSSGKRENIEEHVKSTRVTLQVADLRDPEVALSAVAGRDVVFHLAADHGGRGYVDTKQSQCAGNFLLDAVVFRAAVKGKAGKLVFASSACVYPNHLQTDPKKEVYLKEEMVGPPYDADNLYGYAKLVGEMTLKSYAKAGWLHTASLRFFTVYGPKGKVDHAIMAMLARAYTGQNPFEVWGDGTQVRCWTYVSDIVDGLLLAAEKVSDGTAINLGTRERVTVKEAAEKSCKVFGHQPKFKFLPDMPTGPLNRVADISLAKRLLGWEPKIAFDEGLALTGEWYLNGKNVEWVKAQLATKLMER